MHAASFDWLDALLALLMLSALVFNRHGWGAAREAVRRWWLH